MNIAVIAADGRLGRAFVIEALSNGHHVRAGIRGEKYFTAHENLQIVHCDATNSDELKDLIGDQDVVVSCIGHVKGSSADVQTVATQKLVKAMNELGIKRFVDVTGTGARMPGDTITLLDRFLNFGVKHVDPNRINDGINHMKVLQESNLDWTTIRVLKLQNVTPRPFLLRENGPTKLFVGREEVAKAILQVIKDNSFIGRAPIIGRPL